METTDQFRDRVITKVLAKEEAARAHEEADQALADYLIGKHFPGHVSHGPLQKDGGIRSRALAWVRLPDGRMMIECDCEAGHFEVASAYVELAIAVLAAKARKAKEAQP